MNKILIINLGGIGDLLLSVGALKLLKKKFSNSDFTLLTVGRCKPLMELYNIFTSIYVLPEKKNFFRLLFLLLKLRKEKYDLVINMRTIVSWLSGIKMFFMFKIINGKISAGRDTDSKGFFFDIKIPETYLAEKLEYKYDIDLAYALGAEKVNNIENEIYIPTTGNDKKFIENLFHTHNISKNDFVIGINPGGMQSRQWGERNFVELIQKILKNYKCKIVLTGTTNECRICKKIIKETNSEFVINFCGFTTISQLAEMIKKFHIFISNDTGPVHICVSVGTAGVFIFGPGNLTRYAPFKNKEKYKIIYHPTHCAPCEKKFCKTKLCLRQVSVEEVFCAVEELIKEFYPSFVGIEKC